MASMASRGRGEKRKKVHLSVGQKLDVIKLLESGVSVTRVCEQFGVKKQTVSDIRKAKDKLKVFALKYNVDSIGSLKARKHMKVSKDTDLEEAVFKWYVQERSCGVEVSGVSLRAAADKLAKHMGIPNFKASDGWLWRFRNRHGICNRKVHGESGSAVTESVEPFRLKLNELIRKENLHLSQVYNGDETGLYWRSLPRNTQAFRHEDQIRGKKVSKERFSALCCASADGLHRLKLAVVGKSARPRVLKDYMTQLPVIYYHSKKAWFNSGIFSDWFFKHFIPEVRRYQEEVLKLDKDDVKALLLLDNAPAHPGDDKLVSSDGKIRVMFLPPNTTSVIQPMDQGVIVSCKRFYQRRYLNEVLVVIEEAEDLIEDSRGQRTLQNIKNYNIKSAIYNFADSWNDVKISTLANSWKKLLLDNDPEVDFEGFQPEDFRRMLHRGGETAVTVDDIADWFEENEADPGYQIMTEEEIAEEVRAGDTKKDDSDAEEEEEILNKPKRSAAREAVDTLIQYVSLSDNSDIQPYYHHLRILREAIIKEQYQRGKQMKLDSFFTPVAAPASSEPQPGPSSSHQAASSSQQAASSSQQATSVELGSSTDSE